MLNKVEELLQEVDNFTSTDANEIEQFRIKLIGKKGAIPHLFTQFKDVPNEQKKEFGAKLNELKTKATDKINALKSATITSSGTQEKIDLTRPAEEMQLGSRHPLSLVRNDIIEIFSRIGFNLSLIHI